MLFEQERSGKTSLKGELYSSNEDSSDGIIRVVPFHFKVATGIWNTGQEEQGVGSDSADLCYDSVAQKVADHSRGDKAEQRPFERSVGNSSSSNATAARGTKSQDDDVDDDVQPQTETPAEQGKGATVNQEYPPVAYLLLLVFISVNFCFSFFFPFCFWGRGGIVMYAKEGERKEK